MFGKVVSSERIWLIEVVRQVGEVSDADESSDGSDGILDIFPILWVLAKSEVIFNYGGFFIEVIDSKLKYLFTILKRSTFIKVRSRTTNPIASEIFRCCMTKGEGGLLVMLVSIT